MSPTTKFALTFAIAVGATAHIGNVTPFQRTSLEAFNHLTEKGYTEIKVTPSSTSKCDKLYATVDFNAVKDHQKTNGTLCVGKILGLSTKPPRP